MTCLWKFSFWKLATPFQVSRVSPRAPGGTASVWISLCFFASAEQALCLAGRTSGWGAVCALLGQPGQVPGPLGELPVAGVSVTL